MTTTKIFEYHLAGDGQAFAYPYGGICQRTLRDEHDGRIEPLERDLVLAATDRVPVGEKITIGKATLKRVADAPVFGEYEDTIVPEFMRGEGWVDTAWHNDAMASGVYFLDKPKEIAVRVWVGQDDPAERENGPECPKFIVEFLAEGDAWGDDVPPLYSGDDEGAAKAAAEKKIGEWERDNATVIAGAIVSKKKVEALAALKNFRSAAYDLARVWCGEGGPEAVESVLGAGYPSCLPSFDEFVNEIDGWFVAAEAASKMGVR